MQQTKSNYSIKYSTPSLNKSCVSGVSTCGTNTDIDRIQNLDSLEISSSDSEPPSPTSPTNPTSLASPVSFHEDHINTGKKIIHKVSTHTPVGTRAGVEVKNHNRNKKRNQSWKEKI